ncbi:MAG: hypothetical protein K2L67_05625 [Clostridia bacterium]|nr:hypothetical protein [Clostridia bacterium]
MTVNFCIGLDLGSDTLKIAYAYGADGAEHSGKISCGDSSLTAIPAVAYFDAENAKWYFGEQVDKAAEESFITVVKIKRLLSLLSGEGGAAVGAKNKDYYRTGNQFPNFYFPRRKTATKNFDELVKNEMTFTAEGFTPQSVCEQYFDYVCNVVQGRLARLKKLIGADRCGVLYSVVYPSHSGAEFTAELERLVERSFGKAPERSLSMTKALSVFAIDCGKIKRGESALIFNMGEEEISVVKANVLANGLSVDGVDGHNLPLGLGGNDIDDAVADYLEEGLYTRETMGSPSSGQQGHIVEYGLQSKQYLFVKDIKTAKILLGMCKEGFFASGVPVCVSRDLYIQKKLTKEQFLACTGISENSGVAKKILYYITDEIRRPLNFNVKKVFLSGGLVETHGLVDYLRREIKKLGVEVCTFENEEVDYDGVENNGFNIMGHEDAVYAPALGVAIAALKDYKVKTVIAMSYGLRLFTNDSYCRPFYAILVERGTELKNKENTFTRKNITTGDRCEQSDEMQVIAAPITEREIQQRKYKDKIGYFSLADGTVRMSMPVDDRVSMARLKEAIGVRAISGGGFIRNYYNGRRVYLPLGVSIAIGVSIDSEGRAKAYVTNNDGDRVVQIEYMRQIGNAKDDRWVRTGTTAYVKAGAIKFSFNLGGFVVDGND